MLAEVYRAHFGFVWALLRRLGVHDEDLEDVAQDVFVVVHRRLPQFEGRASVRTWLYAIAVRVAANHRRKRRPGPDAGDSMTGRLAAPSSSNPEAHAVRSEAAQLLGRLLDRMEDKKRAVFVLAEIEGLSAPEIAEIVGTNPRTVHSRLRAARSCFEADLARVHARDRGDPMAARWLRRAAAGDSPPPGADKRVWAALALQLPALEGSVALAGVGAGGLVHTAKAIGLSLGLGIAAIGGLYVLASPLRAADPPAAGADEARPTSAAPTRPDPTSAGSATSMSASVEREDPVSAATADPPELPPATRTRRPTPPATASIPDAARGAAPTDPLRDELDLLGKVRRALAARDYEQALRWTQAHADRHPSGEFASERDRSRLAALCGLGRADEAAELAAAVGLPSACAPR